MKSTAIVAAIGSALALCLTLATTPAAAQLASDVTETRAVRPNRYLLLAGSATLAAAYVPSVVVAITSNRGGDEWLYAPLIGPWADLGNREGCGISGGNCDNEQLYKTLLVTAGITQILGAVAIISSFVIPEYRIEKAPPMRPEVRVSPIRMAQNGYGVGVTGQF